MAIHVPGIRKRNGLAVSSKRKTVASLSLTAMVDMFTVLVIFCCKTTKLPEKR